MGHELLEPGTWEFYMNCGFVLLFVTMASLAAGLTMGLLSLDLFRMQILMETKASDCTTQEQVEELNREKKAAERVIPVISRHHLLLVSLLLLNSVANECLPIFLDKLFPTGVAILLSVTFVLLFGEIIPSAIFTGPNQLFIASALVPLVKAAMFILFPIAYPISLTLDKVLGHEHSTDEKFNKAELRALVKLHAMEDLKEAECHSENTVLRQKLEEAGVDGRTAAVAAMATALTQQTIDEEDEEGTNGLTDLEQQHQQNQHQKEEGHGLELDEVLIMHGAMDLKETTASQKMIPIVHVFMLNMNEELTENRLADLVASGHSRIPVYENDRSNIRGLLLVKKLIVLNPEDKRPVSQLYLRMPVFIQPETSLLELLNEFQKGKSHMAVVTDKPRLMEACLRANKVIPDEATVYGICTLEDIMETLIKEDISDETDFSMGVKRSLFTVQRKKRIIALALQQKKLQSKKLGLHGTALLAQNKNRNKSGSYGSLRTVRRKGSSSASTSSNTRTPLLS